MTAKYYLAWNDIALTNNQGYDKHLYLVKDADGNLSDTGDETIIRGTAQYNEFFNIVFGLAGLLQVENGVTSATSRDGLNNTSDPDMDGYLANDKDEDGNADTPAERHYTEVAISDAQWDSMLTFVTNVGAANYEYSLTAINCLEFQ